MVRQIKEYFLKDVVFLLIPEGWAELSRIRGSRRARVVERWNHDDEFHRKETKVRRGDRVPDRVVLQSKAVQ